MLTFAVAGCTPAAYKADADRQIYKLVEDRKKETLGYEPQVVAATTTQPTIPPRAYRTLPVTPLPPTADSPIEPLRSNLPWEPIGPVDLFDQPLPTVQLEVADLSSGRLRAGLEYGPPAEASRTISLGLFDSIGFGVQHSRQYQDQMESLYIAALSVTLERHLFEPRPFVGGGLRFEGGQQDVGYRSALVATGQAGVRQQLPYGGEVVASTLVTFVDALNNVTADGETAQLALRASVPLLRGAGLVNLEPLIQRERQLVYGVRAFETFRRGFAVDIASRYFRLLTLQQSMRNRYLAFRSFELLVERTEALFGAGKVTALEVQRAQQSLLSAEDGLNDAQQRLSDELDRFKVVLGMPVDQSLDVVPVEVDVFVPDINRPDILNAALKYRLDLQTARDRIDDARRGVGVARNGLLPELNLDAGTSLGNRGGSPASSIDSRTLQYNAGLTLDLPVDRLAERNVYRRTLIDLERARRDTVELEQTVIADVRSAVRGIRSAELSLEIQRQGIELAKKRLDSANEFLLTGRTTNSRDSVEAQNSLLEAQDRYEQARADLQIQILQYLRDSGTLRVDPYAGTLGLAMDRAQEASGRDFSPELPPIGHAGTPTTNTATPGS